MRTSSSSISRGREAALLVAAFAVALSVGLAALELAFGGWLRSEPWDRAHALHIVVDRRVAFDASALYAGGGEVPYTRDRYGLRGAYGEPKDVAILTVGGSTTDQRYIPDGQTWQDVLRGELARAGIRAPVANAGVDGHSTFAHLAAYRDWFPLIPGLKPRYVVLYVGLNDVFLETPREALEGDTEGHTDLRSRIKGNSALFGLYNTLRGIARARQAGVDHTRVDFATVRYTSEPRVAEALALDAPARAAFARRFEALLARVKAQGAVPVCVSQPTMFFRPKGEGGIGIEGEVPIPGAPAHGINGVDFGRILRARDALMGRACTAAGGTYVDLGGMDWDPGDFYDYVHNTPAGARKVGERLAAAMRQLPF